mmetsp:Transcript_16248/g.19538  ORF Transcript_16248/g.19538 Transcript_16248/m.19538 type:complete len:94 (-) Transcript_16248:803-1084(-)
MVYRNLVAIKMDIIANIPAIKGYNPCSSCGFATTGPPPALRKVEEEDNDCDAGNAAFFNSCRSFCKSTYSGNNLQNIESRTLKSKLLMANFFF